MGDLWLTDLMVTHHRTHDPWPRSKHTAEIKHIAHGIGPPIGNLHPGQGHPPPLQCPGQSH